MSPESPCYLVYVLVLLQQHLSNARTLKFQELLVEQMSHLRSLRILPVNSLHMPTIAFTGCNPEAQNVEIQKGSSYTLVGTVLELIQTELKSGCLS